ncbi:MAG: DUF3047 domain-containing protein [Leptothrix sp. (in: b-proteobacteria)]
MTAQRHRSACALLLAGSAIGSPCLAGTEGAAVWVGRFDDGAGPWREVAVNPKLGRNRFELREWDGVAALEVQSRRSMSLYARPITVDLAATPMLCWRWRVDAPLVSADLLTRAGDDYAARVYVSLAVPPEQQSFGLRAQLKVARAIWGPEVPDAALNYVWDNRQAIGTTRANAYTDRAMMVVLRTGASDAGRWVNERRDVGADAVRHYGAGVSAVQLALTADTDNTGEEAHAGFADLHFVARSAPCRRHGASPATEVRAAEPKGSDAAK